VDLLLKLNAFKFTSEEYIEKTLLEENCLCRPNRIYPFVD
jgi:hypothetical protein